MATPTAPVHVALLDDHSLFRQGMRYILESLPYVASVAEAAVVPELLVICRARLPDLVLLDLQMPAMDGPEVAELLLKEFPDLKIIALSMFSADKYITQMMKLGARSYLSKDATQEQLIHALEEVLTTGYHFTLRVSRALMRDVQKPMRLKVNKLPGLMQFTPREEEVLRLICEGRTAADIAAVLFISPRTVEGHRQKLLEKTGTANVVGLAIFAARHGMLDI